MFLFLYTAVVQSQCCVGGDYIIRKLPCLLHKTTKTFALRRHATYVCHVCSALPPPPPPARGPPRALGMTRIEAREHEGRDTSRVHSSLQCTRDIYFKSIFIGGEGGAGSELSLIFKFWL